MVVFFKSDGFLTMRQNSNVSCNLRLCSKHYINIVPVVVVVVVVVGVSRDGIVVVVVEVE